MQVSKSSITATAVAGFFYLGLAASPVLAAQSRLQALSAPIGLSGTEVSCAFAVHQVRPAGWQVDLPGSPTLCRSISWRASDSALEVYESIGAKSGLSVVADVASKTVTIGSRASLAAARVSWRRAAGPQAFADTSVRAPLSAMAGRYRLKLRCASACERSLPGPVTLELSGDIGEDARLLQAALGPFEPLRIVENPIAHTLSANLARQSSFSVELPRPKPWWARLF